MAASIPIQEIEGLPPAMLATIPAAQPPPGVIPDYAHPVSEVPVILGVGTAFFVLAVFSYAVRIYTKLTVVKNLRWDDLTCSLGFICSIIYFSGVIIACTAGGAGRHLWELYLEQVIGPKSLYQDYITTVTATPGLGLIKCTLFIQFYLLFKPLRWLRIAVWIGAIISALFYLPVSIVAFVLNSPWPGESFLQDILSWHYSEFAQFSIPTGIVGMLLDWYLLILPIPAVMTLHMSLGKRFGVLFIFMTGATAAVASTVCLYYRFQLQNGLVADPTWGVGYVLLLTQIEMFAGITVCSMPLVYKFFAGKKLLSTFRTLSWRPSLRQLKGSSGGERLSDEEATSNAPSWNSREHIGYGMNDLKSYGRKHPTTGVTHNDDDEIHLTQGYPVASKR